jgi:hypothetical protein
MFGFDRAVIGSLIHAADLVLFCSRAYPLVFPCIRGALSLVAQFERIIQHLSRSFLAEYALYPAPNKSRFPPLSIVQEEVEPETLFKISIQMFPIANQDQLHVWSSLPGPCNRFRNNTEV